MQESHTLYCWSACGCTSPELATVICSYNPPYVSNVCVLCVALVRCKSSVQGPSLLEVEPVNSNGSFQIVHEGHPFTNDRFFDNLWWSEGNNSWFDGCISSPDDLAGSCVFHNPGVSNICVLSVCLVRLQGSVQGPFLLEVEPVNFGGCISHIVSEGDLGSTCTEDIVSWFWDDGNSSWLSSECCSCPKNSTVNCLYNPLVSDESVLSVGLSRLQSSVESQCFWSSSPVNSDGSALHRVSEYHRLTIADSDHSSDNYWSKSNKSWFSSYCSSPKYFSSSCLDNPLV